MKKLVVHFDFPNVTAQQYDNVWNELRSFGHSNPKGLLFHVGAPKPGGGWIVTDVWDSEEAFKKFSEILMPLIAKQNIPVIQPIMTPAHYVYEGHLTSAM